MAFKINKEKCIGCGACIDSCPMGCIKFDDDSKAQIDESICISCGTCNAVCPVDAPFENED